jgi:NADPH:quinone reductase-like Zn-dependent oxidoreductase
MRAAVLSAFDTPLRITELADPVAGNGEVLVRIKASGVNPLDTKIRRGQAAHAKAVLPAILGIDMAGFDVVFDTVGGATLDDSFTAVKRYTGHVVSALGWGSHSLAPLSFRGATYSGVFTLMPLLTGAGREHHGEILRAAAKLADGGQLEPRLDPHEYTLADVAEAHRAVESSTATGKVVVTIE